VTIFEVGEAGGEVFLAMELLEGEVLRAAMARGDVPQARRLGWLVEAARALAAAHERGLVHRDVKPENMFICKDLTLKLLDFGIAKREEEEAAAGLEVAGPSSLRTAAGRRLGTPRYMAPEQRAGSATDARTDEYAWGLVAFEHLTGAHLLGDLQTSTQDDAASTRDPSGSSLLHEIVRRAPGLPAEVAQAVARALEIPQGARFPSMDPIIAALERALAPPLPLAASAETQDALAPPLAPPRPPRSKRALSLIVGAVGLALACAVVVGVTIARRQQAERARAEARACRAGPERVVPLGAEDRAAMMPGGSLVVARRTPGGTRARFERESSGAWVPFDPLGNAAEYQDVHLYGVTVSGSPGLVLRFDQGGTGTLFELWRPDWTDFGGMVGAQRLYGSFNEEAVLGVRDVAVFATAGLHERMGIGVVAHTFGAKPVHAAIEMAAASDPALASSDTRMGIAYRLGDATRFAFIDRNTSTRIGDVMSIAASGSAPALAFAGEDAVVFWTSAKGGKTRLMQATLVAGGGSFGAPRVAIDEPTTAAPPISVRLASGAHLVAWVGADGGHQIVRAAGVGAGGALTDAGDVAKSASVRALFAAPSGAGAGVAWHDATAGTLHATQVLCGP
jgi:hypothetical protein